MTVKQRIAAIEKTIKPEKKRPRGKAWLVESPDIEKQVERICAGKVKHPDNGEAYDSKDTFFLLRFVDTKKEDREKQDEIRTLEEEKERLLREIAVMEKSE